MGNRLTHIRSVVCSARGDSLIVRHDYTMWHAIPARSLTFRNQRLARPHCLGGDRSSSRGCASSGASASERALARSRRSQEEPSKIHTRVSPGSSCQEIATGLGNRITNVSLMSPLLLVEGPGQLAERYLQRANPPDQVGPTRESVSDARFHSWAIASEPFATFALLPS